MFARRTRRRLLAALAAPALLAAGLATMGMTAAGASAAPLQFRPEAFTITFPGGDGFASGPVHGAFTDNEFSPAAGVWTFDADGSRVLVRHTFVPAPRVNPFTCRGVSFDRGTWEMSGLSGRYRDAEGFGRFTAFSSIREARHHGQCDPGEVISQSTFVSGFGQAIR